MSFTSSLLFCGVQIVMGLFSFGTYRSYVDNPDRADENAGILPIPRVHWPPLVTGLAVVNYVMITLSSVLVLSALDLSLGGGFAFLVWVAFFVYFGLVGMMSAVVFPEQRGKAVLHVASPFLYALAMTLLVEDELGESVKMEILFMGIYFTTVLPSMLAVLFVQVGWEKVKKSLAVVIINLAVILTLCVGSVSVWVFLIPDLLDDDIISWVVMIVSTMMMFSQYIHAWRRREKTLVDAGLE